MLVIMGHGPSLIGKGRGPWIDNQFVVRLKAANIPNPEDWGTRTDAVAGYRLEHRRPGVPFWWFPKPNEGRAADGVTVARGDWWRAQYARHAPRYKMSTGLAAICAAIDVMAPAEIGLAGFDNLLRPHERGWTKWSVARYASEYRHDAQAEHDFAMSLGVRLIDITDEGTCQTFSITTP